MMIYTGSNYIDMGTTTNSSINWHLDTPSINMVYNNEYTNLGWKDSKTYKVRAEKKKRGSKSGINDPSKRLTPLGPLVIFRILKKKFTGIELGKLNTRLEQVSKVLEAIPRSQIALTEELEKKVLRIMREAEMASCGFNKFIEKETLEKYIKVCKNKVIKITKLKNYARFLPYKARLKMTNADIKGLFDGYVVIHTDPNNTAVKKTLEEKRDPILCGVIAESDRFYFVADWTDELCDLTLETIIDKLGLSEKEYKMDKDFGKIFTEALNI